MLIIDLLNPLFFCTSLLDFMFLFSVPCQCVVCYPSQYRKQNKFFWVPPSLSVLSLFRLHFPFTSVVPTWGTDIQRNTNWFCLFSKDCEKHSLPPTLPSPYPPWPPHLPRQNSSEGRQERLYSSDTCALDCLWTDQLFSSVP